MKKKHVMRITRKRNPNYDDMVIQRDVVEGGPLSLLTNDVYVDTSEEKIPIFSSDGNMK
jgi:hypothetical protein